jgi:hypothetical protein
MVTANNGLLNLFNMAPLYNGLLDQTDFVIVGNNNCKSISTTNKNRLGDFFAIEWMDENAKKRHLGAGTLVGRCEKSTKNNATNCPHLLLTKDDGIIV